MVYGTVKSHGGFVTLDSAPGQGTTVTIHLPALAPSAAPSPVSRDDAPVSPAEGTVLLVDDEALVRATGQRILETLGYTALVAGGGREAVEIYRKRGNEVSFVIIDLAMPEMDGGETLAALQAIDPAVRALVSSGFVKDKKVDDLIARGAIGFIQKPYTMQGLAQQIDRAIHRSG
jgi:DNA-binding NtrC family response regulator